MPYDHNLRKNHKQNEMNTGEKSGISPNIEYNETENDQANLRIVAKFKQLA